MRARKRLRKPCRAASKTEGRSMVERDTSATGPSRAGIYFATGIENSNPTIDNGRVRIDEMESCGHYEHWSIDFDKVQELGISFLRYGPPLYKTFLEPNRFDWS